MKKLDTYTTLVKYSTDTMNLARIIWNNHDHPARKLAGLLALVQAGIRVAPTTHGDIDHFLMDGCRQSITLLDKGREYAAQFTARLLQLSVAAKASRTAEAQVTPPEMEYTDQRELEMSEAQVSYYEQRMADRLGVSVEQLRREQSAADLFAADDDIDTSGRGCDRYGSL